MYVCIYIINAWGCKELERENGIPWANTSRYVCQSSSLRIDPWKVQVAIEKKQWRFPYRNLLVLKHDITVLVTSAAWVGCNRLRLIRLDFLGERSNVFFKAYIFWTIPCFFRRPSKTNSTILVRHAWLCVAIWLGEPEVDKKQAI